MKEIRYDKDNKQDKSRLKHDTSVVKRLKNIFESCYIDKDGLCVSNMLDSAITFGRHYAKLKSFDILELIPFDKILKLETGGIYNIMKEKNGKYVERFYIVDNRLMLEHVMEDKLESVAIGELIDKFDDFNKYRDVPIANNMIRLTDRMIEDCIEYTSLIEMGENISLQFSKYLIPYLSAKESVVDVSTIADINVASAIFGIEISDSTSRLTPIIFLHDRLDVLSFHSYIIMS